MGATVGLGPRRYYRLWCGRRCWSGWKSTVVEAMTAGIAPGVTFEDGANVHMGPLAWIEVGERRYPKAKTVSLGPNRYDLPPPGRARG